MGSSKSKVSQESSSLFSTYSSNKNETTPSINQLLRNLSNEMVPSNDYIRNGNIIANRILNILRCERRDIDRNKIAGSIGKKTAIGESSDFDLVIFMNNKEPPFDSVLGEIFHTLEEHKGLFTDYKCLNITKMFIAFEISGYKFDLSPAPNYKISSVEDQRKSALEKIKGAQDNQKYSSGFAECAVDFLKQQSEFVHCVIRLAKFWNGNIIFPKINNKRCYIGGRSLMIELLAIHACKKVAENDIYGAFQHFLNDIAHFEKQHIFFDNYYKEHHIPSQVWNYMGPMILDPMNYWNNLAHHKNIPTKAVEIYKEMASKSLSRLENWAADPNWAANKQIHVTAIFLEFEC